MSDLLGNHIVGFPTRRLIYNSYSLYKLFYLKLISDEAFTYYSPPKTPCGKKNGIAYAGGRLHMDMTNA